MFNTYDNFKQSIIMPPACMGTLQKTFRKSWFRRFHLESEFADKLFKAEYQKRYVILQVMTFGDGWLLAELAEKSDYDAMYKSFYSIKNDQKD